MNRANIIFALVVITVLTLVGCQKDNPLIPTTNDSQPTVNLQYPNTPGTQLVLNPTSIEGFNKKLPAFDLEHFRATHQPIDIFKKFNIEEEDLPYLLDEVDELADLRSSVLLEAGSVDGLADAIDEAGEGGKVIVESGTHYESGRVVICEEVKIIGQPGAIIESAASDNMPALHIKNTEDVKIQGLELLSTGSNGTLAILIEDSEETKIKNNTILGFDISIANEEGEESKIVFNTMVGTGNNHCFININGEDLKVLGNDISGGFFGAWLCDEGGKYKYNTTNGNVFGMILCKVPAGSFPLPDGGFTGAENPGNEWKVKFNSSNNNAWGYIVIDGAHDNKLVSNSGSNNGIDMELAGETNNLFGMFTPTSEDNIVKIGGTGIDVIDCGLNNVVQGGPALPGPCSD